MLFDSPDVLNSNRDQVNYGMDPPRAMDAAAESNYIRQCVSRRQVSPKPVSHCRPGGKTDLNPVLPPSVLGFRYVLPQDVS